MSRVIASPESQLRFILWGIEADRVMVLLDGKHKAHSLVVTDLLINHCHGVLCLLVDLIHTVGL